MAKNGLNELANKQFLSDCWHELFSKSKKRKRDGFGINGISLNLFKEHKKDQVQRISSAIKAKTYSPSSLVPYFIPKANGKDRVICVPTIPDRLVQRALIKLLNDRGYGFNNSINFGFVKGKSVGDAATKAKQFRSQKPWIYKADIAQFFDTIDRDILFNKVKQKVRMTSIHPLIEKIIQTEIFSAHQGVEKRIAKMGIKRGVGLRQGMPASPYLANVMLSDFDKQVEKRKLTLIRYADDIIAFGKSEEECKEIHSICSELLNDEKLFVHPIGHHAKTEIVEPDGTVEFLGLGLTKVNSDYELVVTQKQLDSLRQKILQVSDIDYCRKQRITISKLTKKLTDMINGYYSAYDLCSNSDQLSDCLSAAKSLAMKNLFINEFKIPYDSLSKKQRDFLEISE